MRKSKAKREGLPKLGKTEDLVQYENVKLNALNREFNEIRKMEFSLLSMNTELDEGKKKEVLEEVNKFREIINRIEAVIYEQMKQFSEQNIIAKLQQQLEILKKMEGLALFYRQTDKKEHLEDAYNKIFELLQKFKKNSESVKFLAQNEEGASKAA